MSKRRRKRSSSSFSSSGRSKRTGLQTAVETMMGVGAAVLFVGIAIWWFFLRPTSEAPIPDDKNYAKEAVSGNVIEDELAYQTILEGNDLELLKNLLTELDSWKRDAQFTVRLDTLNRRIEVANKILEHLDTDENLRIETAKKLLTSYGQYYGISTGEGLANEQFVANYLSACDNYSKDPNKDLAKLAVLSKAKVQIYETTNRNGSSSTDSAEQTINDLASRFPDDSDVLLTIRQLISRIGLADIRLAGKISREVVAKYEATNPTNDKIIRQIRQMKDTFLLEDSQVGVIFRDAQSNGDFEPYFKELEILLKNKDTGVVFLNAIYETIRFFESTEQYDFASRVIEILEASWQSRSNPNAREHAFRMAKFGRLRNNILGKKIDFTDTQSNGEPVRPELIEGKPCILVYYSPNAPDTADMFNNLNFTYKLLYKTNVRIIAISVEPAKGQTYIESFDPSWISISSSIEKTSKIFKQCPTIQVPYFAVIRADGTVDSVGITAGKLKTKIEGLVAADKVSAEGRQSQ